MINSSNQGGHSAHVKMQLIVNGVAIQVAQMGPDFILIDSEARIPACEATLVMKVDQSESRWNVQLPNGTLEGSNRVVIAPCR